MEFKINGSVFRSIVNEIKEFKKRERRRKRFIYPFAYFLVQILFLWLLVGLSEFTLYIDKWSSLGKIIFALITLYFLSKMLKIYARQKNYKTDL